jgi:hypothetical protein
MALPLRADRQAVCVRSIRSPVDTHCAFSGIRRSTGRYGNGDPGKAAAMMANTATASETSRTMTSFIAFADVPDQTLRLATARDPGRGRQLRRRGRHTPRRHRPVVPRRLQAHIDTEPGAPCRPRSDRNHEHDQSRSCISPRGIIRVTSVRRSGSARWPSHPGSPLGRNDLR